MDVETKTTYARLKVSELAPELALSAFDQPFTIETNASRMGIQAGGCVSAGRRQCCSSE